MISENVQLGWTPITEYLSSNHLEGWLHEL
jgi:hypothetical protein